ncbi:MSCRAMM family adhesin SdrC [Halomarina rubra]|uniref:MSCRAMM family adhesin SdrC n=1 Tax=Halomarina rubra TaxID=2071873 RepID=A0ABD6AYS0_9EURY|nr:MSCRAMM family adhesin SdrC [Halomarina rubra]
MALLLVSSAGLAGVGAVTLQDDSTDTGDFVISDVSAPDTAESGEKVIVTATVTNVGANDTQDVYAGADTDDDGDIEGGLGGLDGESLTLATNESTTVEFSVETVGFDLGEGTILVKSDTDTASTTVTIVGDEYPGEFIPTEPDAPDTVTEGETFTVSANVSNTGNAGTLPVSATVYDGDNATDVSATQNLTLNYSERKTVEFELSADDLEPGEYDVVVSTPSEMVRTTLTVTESDAGSSEFMVEITDYDETVMVGETYTVNATVSNVGDDGTETLEAGFDTDGDSQIDVGTERDLTLAYEGVEDVTFELSTDNLVDSEHTLIVRGDQNGDSRPVTADDPYDVDPGLFEYSNVSVPETAVIGEEIQVSATLTNYGGTDYQYVEIGADYDDDGEIDSERLGSRVGLEHNESTTIDVSLDTSGFDAGDGTIILRTRNVPDTNGTAYTTATVTFTEPDDNQDDSDDEQNNDDSDDNQDENNDDSSEERYYQVDLVVGEPNEKLGETTEDFYSPEGRLVSYLHGTTADGETSSATASSLNPEYSDAIEASDIEISEDGETAEVTVTVADGESLTLSLVSYETPDATFDWDETQTMVDAETMTLDGGTYTFTVDLPDAEH